jgi:purine-cytosine permease-like protein
MTFFGLYIPICFISILGAALMTITDPSYVAAFEDGSMGGLIAQTLSPWGGFGKFLLVVLALSVIANNMVNTYSTGISIQALGRPFAMVPRTFWTLVGFAAYTVAGIVGREHFSAILSNFLSILSYWTAFFMVITLEEHFIFRRKGGVLGGYNLDDWDSPSKLPLGVAGIVAGCCGIAGAVVGMAEVWYIGPIGLHAGNPEFGGDLGFELAAAFAGISYPLLRWLEIRLVGR